MALTELTTERASESRPGQRRERHILHRLRALFPRCWPIENECGLRVNYNRIRGACPSGQISVSLRSLSQGDGRAAWVGEFMGCRVGSRSSKPWISTVGCGDAVDPDQSLSFDAPSRGRR
jgi:hypothetical protein